MNLLLFELDELRCAIDASLAREVVRAVAVTPLPGAPAVVEGVIDIRGTTVPVLDVRSRFGLSARPAEPTDHMIIAWTGSRIVALRVTRAEGLQQIDPAAIDDARQITKGADAIEGVARLPDGLAIIYDLPRFLSAAEAESLARALQ